MNVPVVSLAIPTEEDNDCSSSREYLNSKPFNERKTTMINEDSEEDNDPVAQIKRMQSKQSIRQSWNPDVKMCNVGL